MSLYGIVGAGGFGREVLPVAQEMLARTGGPDDELVFVVEESDHEPVNGVRVFGEAEFVNADDSKKYFNVAIASHAVREEIADRLIEAGIEPFRIKAGSAVVLDANRIGEGAILCPFTTITSNATIGRFFHANIYSYVAHDCVIGDFVTFAPSVHCNGQVTVEDYAYVGTGAVIRQGSDERPIVIGRGAVVGMGAVVTKSVEPFTTVIGNPATQLRRKST